MMSAFEETGNSATTSTRSGFWALITAVVFFFAAATFAMIAASPRFSRIWFIIALNIFGCLAFGLVVTSVSLTTGAAAHSTFKNSMSVLKMQFCSFTIVTTLRKAGGFSPVGL